MQKKTIPIELIMITRGAMAIACIFIFFLVFKGVTNILNALFVPITLYLFSINQKAKEIMTLYLTTIIFTILFFNKQSFFIVFYCFIAFLLIKLRENNVKPLLSALILTFAVSFSFYISIKLTDYFFLTHMEEIIIKILKGNYFVYGIMLIIEGALVGISQLILSKVLFKRISSIYK